MYNSATHIEHDWDSCSLCSSLRFQITASVEEQCTRSLADLKKRFVSIAKQTLTMGND